MTMMEGSALKYVITIELPKDIRAEIKTKIDRKEIPGCYIKR